MMLLKSVRSSNCRRGTIHFGVGMGIVVSILENKVSEGDFELLLYRFQSNG